MASLPSSWFAPVLAAPFLLVSCGSDATETQEAAARPFDAAAARALFGPEVVPAGEPASPELIALGRDLYHEKRLSVGDNVSCATCHDLDRYGVDGEPTSPGSDGTRGARNSPTSVNAFRQFAQFWDGRAQDVEEQAQGPVLNPIEHGFEEPDVFLAKLRAIEGMPERFAALFPDEDDPVTMANFGRAVGAFERTLVTRSRFDDFLDGDDDALTVEEKAGLQLFMDTGCATCHMTRTFGGQMFQKIGVQVPYETADLGRAEVTGRPEDRAVFKVPMLLNCAETGPWFHDGSVATLDEAVRRMAKHQLGKDLDDGEIRSIVTFLKALTGEPQWTVDAR